MEEVASMSVKARDHITELFGSPPVLIQAADFGWVHRARLYWGGYMRICLRLAHVTGCGSTSHRISWSAESAS